MTSLNSPKSLVKMLENRRYTKIDLVKVIDSPVDLDIYLHEISSYVGGNPIFPEKIVVNGIRHKIEIIPFKIKIPETIIEHFDNKNIIPNYGECYFYRIIYYGMPGINNYTWDIDLLFSVLDRYDLYKETPGILDFTICSNALELSDENILYILSSGSF